MNDVPSFLTDESIERTQAIGEAMIEFLERRRRAKEIDPNATVDVGPQLRDLFGELWEAPAAHASLFYQSLSDRVQDLQDEISDLKRRVERLEDKA